MAFRNLRTRIRKFVCSWYPGDIVITVVSLLTCHCGNVIMEVFVYKMFVVYSQCSSDIAIVVML